MPEAPDGGLLASARYFVSVVRARHARRAGMRTLAGEIQSDVAVLDGILGSLGRAARAARIDARVLVEENRGIDAAEARREEAARVGAEVQKKLEEEQRRFEEVERELTAKLAAAEQAARAAGEELSRLTDERKAARDKKKDVDRRQKGYLKSAEDREKQAANAQMGEQRSALRRSAEDLRSDAARLEPERVELEKLVAGLEESVTKATAVNAAARGDLDGTRKALEDARAGHRHRRGELEAQAAQKARAGSDAAAEIDRRLVTLGTLLNLNRVPGAELDTLYHRVDALKAVIAGREKEIDRLKGEADQLDRGAAVRGAAVLAGAVVVLITVICILIVVL
jgi:DNA repair exonuclease SbcCD ATPase subunit